MPIHNVRSIPYLRTRRATSLAALISFPVLTGLACSGADVTELGSDPAFDPPASDGTTAVEETEVRMLERLRAENEAFIEERMRDGWQRYDALTDEERAALESGPSAPSAEDLLAEWNALQHATLSAQEEEAVRALFAAGGPQGEELSFRGRMVSRGDVVYTVDQLLSAGGGAAVNKAVMPLGAGPGIPDAYVAVPSGQFMFRRPDTTRHYFMVVPDAVANANPWLMDDLLLATNAISTALADDCISNILVPIRTSTYNELSELERQTSSVITVAYGPNVCPPADDPASGCASYPFVENMTLSPGVTALRMRFGNFLGLDNASDDWNQANARNVALHELTHTLGFEHPELYPGLNTTLDLIPPRVPGTSAARTVPTATLPTAHSLFSFPLSTEDKQALRKLYAGSCGYDPNFRTIAAICSTTNEQACQRHGGTCEVDSSGVSQCRWHHLKNSTSCNNHSLGNWTTANPLPGEAGSCILPSSSIAAVYSNESSCTLPAIHHTVDLGGRCCSQGVPSEGAASRNGILFRAYTSGSTTTHLCSEQPNLWNDNEWNATTWEFDRPSHAFDFVAMDPVTSGTANGWQMSGGAYEQTVNRTDSMLIGNEEMRFGCLTTLVTTTDDDESGIVFDYQNSQNFFAFDVTPGVRRRIRRVQNGVSTDLSNILINVQTTWSPGIKLMVCFTNGTIHTFINNTASRVSVHGPWNFSGPSGRYVGVWNSWNDNARHEYLRSFPVINGFLGQF